MPPANDGTEYVEAHYQFFLLNIKLKQMNRFQDFMTNPANMDIVKGVIAIFHPDINLDKRKITIYIKHDWVIIHTEGIDIGVEVLPNEFCAYNGFMEPGYTAQSFQKSLDNGTCIYKAWRFVDDSKYAETETEEYIKPEKLVHEYLKDKNVPIPTAQEMYKYYYRSNSD
ncbi:MAG: hypothetical protein ACK52I_09925 [Pseudomonadota bacterium]